MSAHVISDADIAMAYRGYGLNFEPYGPNLMQKALYRSMVGESEDCALLLKAPTGSGKTEAVTVPALETGRRLFLIYPARSLLQDQEMRIAQMLQYRSRQNSGRAYALVVDTGAEMYRHIWMGAREVHGERWERRHLLHGDVILTTLDKLVYRFFGFGEERKGYIYPLRLRYGRRPLFCFDEAHSYDDIAFGNFVDLVRAIGFNAEAPRDLIVMTATMPEAYAKELGTMLTARDYTAPEMATELMPWMLHPEKAFALRETSADAKDAEMREDVRREVLALVNKHHQTGRRTIVVLEEVRDAVELYRILAEQWHDAAGKWLLLYHGRQTYTVRSKTYKQLKELDKGGSYLLITTSAIEVGCDLDAHTLITQLCNPEQLIQRAGRCNRRGTMLDARIVVVGGRIPNYLRTLPESVLPEYLDRLREMSSARVFKPRPFLDLPRRPVLTDYRVRTMFDMLYEYVYEAERANQPLHDKGLVVTRSWEPTITITTGWDGEQRLQNELQIGIRSCVASKDEKVDERCEVYIRRYDENAEGVKRWMLHEPTFGGSAYAADIIVRVPLEPEYFDQTLGYVNPPKVFAAARRSGYRHGILYRRRTSASAAPGDQAPHKPTPPSGGDGDDAETPEEQAAVEAGKGSQVFWWYLADLPRLEDDTEEIAAAEEREEIDADEDKETLEEEGSGEGNV